MVLPDSLIDNVLSAKGSREMWASVATQLTLADFLSSGAYDRHLRRTRAAYRHRRDLLVRTLAQRAPHIRVSGIAAGLRAVLELPYGTEDSTPHAARRRGLVLDGLRRYRHPPARMPHRDGLVIGYGTPSTTVSAPHSKPCARPCPTDDAPLPPRRRPVARG
ncbi:hypothetical protein [Nocardia sp. NPDC051981]|uniref:hypothetical protein n=1 Tax=Nocardia sp. NPDC051981 TaxID=3155417 RepID=UPI00343F7477